MSLPNLLLSSGANGSPWWISAIEAFIIINLVLVCFAYLTLAERKVMGRMQLRYGPNRAGPYGLLQPIADLVKLIRKESFFPAAAIDVLYIFAPFLAAFTALCTFSVIPWGPGWEIGGYQINGYVADLPIALLLIFAIGSLGIYGFILGGWSSDSKFALLGSMRTCAQLVSYEVSLALSVLGVILMARSLSLVDIVQAQADSTWYIAPQFVGFVIFLMAGTAETARAPFDLPEAEQELVAGYHTEYGGMRFGLFSMSEYINLITLTALCVTLFLGGWHGPWFPGPIWFLIKLFLLLFVFIWVRTTVPRLRYDQLMRFGWKVLLPIATLNAVITAILVVASRCQPRSRSPPSRASASPSGRSSGSRSPSSTPSSSGRSTRASAAGTCSTATRTGSRSASAARSAPPRARRTASASSRPRTPPTTASPPASATRASTRST